MSEDEGFLLKRFRKKPTIKDARLIWLVRSINGYPIPDDVLKVMIEDVKKQVRKANKKTVKTHIEKSKDRYLIGILSATHSLFKSDPNKITWEWIKKEPPWGVGLTEKVQQKIMSHPEMPPKNIDALYSIFGSEYLLNDPNSDALRKKVERFDKKNK